MGMWWLSGWGCGGSVVKVTADSTRLQTQQSWVRIRLTSESPERGQEIKTVYHKQISGREAYCNNKSSISYL
jgi:hypothetical protein